MSTINNGANQKYQNNSDGYQLGGGTTVRTITYTGADMTFTGSGSNTYTFPASSDTLAGLTSPSFTTPVLGVATATSINGLTLTTSTGVITITNAKTLAVTNSLTLSGTDATIMTFPTTSATIARTDASQTFTSQQTFTTGPLLSGGLQTASSIGNSNLFTNGGSGGTTSTTAGLLFAGAAQIKFRAGSYGNTTSTFAISDSGVGFIVGPGPWTTAASGTHAMIANMVIQGLGTVTSGGATVTTTASLYIAAASAAGTNNYALYINSGANRLDGKTGIGGVTTATAYLHLAAGTASAGTAPLKLTSGTNLGTTEAGTIEYDGTHLYFTAVNAGTRYQLDNQSASGGITVGSSAITGGTTTRVLYDNAGNLGEYVITGIGTTVAMATNPTLTSVTFNAGTTVAATAPIYLTSGALLTAPEVGAIEFLTDSFYGTITTGAARQTFATLQASQTFTGSVIFSGNSVKASSGIQTASSSQSSNFLTFGGTGAATAITSAEWLFAGATQVKARVGINGSTSSTLAVSDSYAAFILSSVGITTAASGTHALLASAVINPLGTVTSGGATVTNTATLYVNGAGAGGTTNYAFWVATGTSIFGGDIKLGTAGNGFYVKEGSNATMGVATLSAGTVTVSTTKVTANSRIHLTVQSLGTVSVATPVAVTARSAGTSFTITSSGGTDTSVIAWLLIEPS